MIITGHNKPGYARWFQLRIKY